MNSATAASIETESFPISLAQRRLWLIEQLQPGTSAYNLPIAWRLHGPLDGPAFARAVNEVIHRHGSLRTTFRMHEDQLEQQIGPFEPILLPITDLSLTRDPEAEAHRLIDAEVGLAFDLETGPLVRLGLLRLSDTEHVFVFNAHHIVWDGWSINLLRNELTLLYPAFCAGEASPLPDLPRQYAELAMEQQEVSSEATWKEHLEYWKQQLGGSWPALELPTDQPRPDVPTFRGAAESCHLDSALISSLRTLSRKHGATLFMTLLAGFKALLQRYTGQEDILVGSPVGGRDAPGSEDLIGFFVNTVALRTGVGGDPSFTELLSRVRQVTLEAYEHQDVPFDRVVREIQPERNLGDPDPLIQVVMGFEGGAVHEWTMGSLRAGVMDIGMTASKFDWTFLLEETSGGVRARLEYNTDLFTAQTIKQFVNHFRILLEGIVENPQRRISEFPLLTGNERQKIVFDWNKTSTHYERDRCVHELFEARATENPNATALVFGERQMTYAELDRRASELARRLRQKGIRSGQLAGLFVERSFDLIVAILGILKAGAAYVPLDRSYPRERLAFILEDTAVAAVVADSEFDESILPSKTPHLIRVGSEKTFAEETNHIPSGAKAEEVAYVMYTSGSTGVPKGVPVSHRGITRLVRNTNYATFGPADVFLQVAPVSFDASTLEIWGALLNGGKLVIAPPQTLTLEELGRTIRQHQISTLWLTAGLFHQMVDHQLQDLKSVRQLLAGGDVLSVPHVLKALRALPGCQLINGYGPTENTTFTCCHRVPADWHGGRSVPIGKPISNTEVYILDKNLSPVPIGLPGELCIGGDGLARGYWNRPDLTSEKFVPHPFRDGSNDVIYKTGDAARFLPDGTIEFLGRKDQQVKIRGFRIELGEIETALATYPGVAECAVMACGQAKGEAQLVAYFVCDDRQQPDAGQLRKFLERKLPQPMVPSFFVRMDELPLTANGKVDRKALPEPGSQQPELEKKYASPRDEIELKLTRIWESCLGVTPIGIEDKFFDLGGHSLTAVRVIAQIEKAFGKKLRLATLFQAPSIEQLAVVLRDEIQEGRSSKDSSIVEICSHGSRTPLFLVHGAGGGMFWGYVNLSRHLGPDQPVYGFRSRGLAGKEEFGRLEEMAAQYVADMRLVQPHGPYQLGGYCFGGNVAYEMVRQLSLAGETVRVLALINCSPPNTSYSRMKLSPLWLGRFIRNLVCLAGDVRHLPPDQRSGFFRWKYRRLKHLVGSMLHISAAGRAEEAVENLVDLSSFSEEQQRLWRVHIQAQSEYHPQPYPGRVQLFRSPGHSVVCSFDQAYGWGELAEKGVDVFVVPAAHEKILEEPFVEAVASPLKELLCALRFSPLPAAAQTSPRLVSTTSSGTC